MQRKRKTLKSWNIERESEEDSELWRGADSVSVGAIKVAVRTVASTRCVQTCVKSGSSSETTRNVSYLKNMQGLVPM